MDIFESVVVKISLIIVLDVDQALVSVSFNAIKSKSLLFTSVMTPTQVFDSSNKVDQVLSLYTKSPTLGLNLGVTLLLPLTVRFKAQVLFIYSPLYLTHKFSGGLNIPF